MRVIVDRAGCVGHARCAAVAPDLFPLDPEGLIATEGFPVQEKDRILARNGARACPERIIKFSEDV